MTIRNKEEVAQIPGVPGYTQGNSIFFSVIGLSILGLSGSSLILDAAAQSDTASEAQPVDHLASESGLKLPDDLDHSVRGDSNDTDSLNTDPVSRELVSPDPVAKYTIEERRIGTRLERLTVHRNNGIDETYEVRKADSMSANEENELGEMPNVRRWTLGSW